MTDTMTQTYDILFDNLGAMQKLIARLNKKAAKLDVAPIVLTTGKPYEVTAEDGITVDRFVPITVTGETPKLNGWQFVATLQHGEEGNILRVVPGFEESLPEEFRTSDPSRCDHCHINRYRVDTYVVYNDELGYCDTVDDPNRWQQVGSSCLRDFLGHQNPHKYAEMATWMSLIREAADTLSERGGWGPNGPSMLLLQSALEWVAESVIRSGWVSRGKAREDNRLYATADRALDAMENAAKGRTCTWKTCRDYEKCEVHFTPSDAAKKLAETALEWGREWAEAKYGKDNENDYAWNLHVALAGDSIDMRSFGIAASVIGVYQREMTRLAKERAAAENTTSEWIGKVGDKLTLTLTVDAVKYLNSDFGTTSLITYHDADNNVVNWFASKYLSVEVGKTVTVKGTVKGLNEFRGVRQTTLTRVKEIA
jgi:hypothetical protein